MPNLLTDIVNWEIPLRLGGALGIGALIGLERSYHGRPAGFRTHALVSLSTCLLALVTVYEAHWFPALGQGRITLDPTRMAQGIMTGIGFLGAGAIVREGVSIRGLTTAASIWTTAAIGVLVGIGFYFPAILASVFALGVLSVFQWIESRIPARYFANFYVRFRLGAVPSESQLRKLVIAHGFRVSNFVYKLDRDDGYFEYRMLLQAKRGSPAAALSAELDQMDAVRGFAITPTGD